MKTHKPRITLLALAAATALLVAGPLAACGSSSSSNDDGVKTITVATGNDGNPFCYMDTNGKLTGYDVAIMNAVGDKLKQYYKFTFMPSDFPTSLTNLASGKAQIAAYEYEVNDQRKAKFTYGTVGTTKWDTLIISDPKNGPVYQSFDELKGKKVYATTATNQAAMAETYLKSHPDAFKLVYGTYTNEQTVQAIASGAVDATLAPQYNLDLFNSQLKAGFKGSDGPVHKSAAYLLFQKNADKTLMDRVNKAMQEIKDDGTMKKLSVQYLGADYVPE
ncbi:transporter substrate-binding domain-containing protein [Bifidobacterium sp.]|jgi:ABC-type amino acid transport substrate-binding protein|uniref:transporter substrate-binding domain-containing protein n=1 Tax=Bifidobacterium sp. TaxID=41200 RepID=UPI0025B92B79|nr:transporter substrate-binding domain-containing protein [Bifidobacterium sp.]MCH4208809.1 transporter substrate-binding domain-containing protein [Bifidobacterium sp.]MCI1224767.1 transporter substrate-binding domain-containing protein [Bifidobacterium sp.]